MSPVAWPACHRVTLISVISSKLSRNLSFQNICFTNRQTVLYTSSERSFFQLCLFSNNSPATSEISKSKKNGQICQMKYFNSCCVWSLIHYQNLYQCALQNLGSFKVKKTWLYISKIPVEIVEMSLKKLQLSSTLFPKDEIYIKTIKRWD